MSQRLGVVLHKNPPRLRWIYDLNWFRDRDCTHTHTHTHILSVRTIFLCNGGESCATSFNTAPRQGGRERGKWRHVARSIFRVQVYLENFISRVTWRLFRRRVRTDTASSSRYTAAPCNSVSEIRNSRQPGGNPPRGWENGEEIRDRGRVFFLFFFLFFTLVRVLRFHRGSVENLGTSRKFLVARRASNSSCLPSLPLKRWLKSLQREAWGIVRRVTN